MDQVNETSNQRLSISGAIQPNIVVNTIFFNKYLFVRTLAERPKFQNKLRTCLILRVGGHEKHLFSMYCKKL